MAASSFLVSRLDNAAILSLLKEEDFSFSMRGWKGDVRDFFAPSASSHREILEERAGWLSGAPDRYAAALPAAGEILGEMESLLEVSSPRETDSTGSSASTEGTAIAGPLSRCLRLGKRFEPDFVILEKFSADEGDPPAFRAVAGVVCFPSNWSFPAMLGKKIHEIHAIVPGLNDAIGPRIAAMLERLPAGESWSRLNWGISLSAERNQHPDRRLPRLADRDEDSLPEAWLRVELQVLHKFAEPGAVLFGIRPCSISFDEIAGAPPGVARALKRQLDTMPREMKDYKGLGDRAHVLDRWLSRNG